MRSMSRGGGDPWNWRIVKHDVVDSTNEVAKALLYEGASPGTVVVADKQIQGRGRSGKSWASPRGGLYFSIILREDISRLPILSLGAAVAISEAIEDLRLKTTLKWPNDVLLEGSKVAGILVEGVARPEGYWAIVGIGINSDLRFESLPAEVEFRATTIREVLGQRVDNEALLDSTLKALSRLYTRPEGDEEILARYRESCSTIGQTVRIRTGQGVLEGTATGVNPDGRLTVETEDGQSVQLFEGTVLRQD